MLKQISIAAAIGAAFASGGVNAQALQPNAFAGASIQIHLSGATAPQGQIINRVQNDLCGGQFTRMTNLTGAGTGSGLLQVAIGCTTSNGTLAFYYTTTGSNFGVQPVIKATALPRLDVANASCNGSFTPLAAQNTRLCTATTSSVPNLGLSDIPPAAFVNVGPDGITVNNVPSAADLTTGDLAFMSAFPASVASMSQPVDPADLANVTVRPVQGIIFGLVASHALAAQLGAVSPGTTTGTATNPSGGTISKAQARAILTTAGFQKGDVASLLGFPEPAVFKICKRTTTSGTQAWANTYFRQAGFEPRRGSASPGTSVDGFTVIENLTSGNIRTCMDAATAAGEFAIGIISRESGNLPTGTTAGRRYVFLGIDGATPDKTGVDKFFAKNGGYDNIGEATLQYRNGSLGTSQLAFVDSLVEALTGVATTSTVCSDAGAVTLANEDFAQTTTCEARATRRGDAFAPAEIRE